MRETHEPIYPNTQEGHQCLQEKGGKRKRQQVQKEDYERNERAEEEEA